MWHTPERSGFVEAPGREKLRSASGLGLGYRDKNTIGHPCPIVDLEYRRSYRLRTWPGLSCKTPCAPSTMRRTRDQSMCTSNPRAYNYIILGLQTARHGGEFKVSKGSETLEVIEREESGM